MSIIIIAIMVLGYLLIATANYTNVNKAAVAMFMAVVGWIVYICYGYDFVLDNHPRDFLIYLMGDAPTSEGVKMFVAQNIFIKYVGKAAEVILFLIATMTIVEILSDNGCFDFLQEILRTRNARKMLWMVVGITLILSANIDNVTVTTMMLVMIHKLLASRRDRLTFGCAIVLASNCGGCLTVIGDPFGLALWNEGAVTASNYTVSMLVPVLLACAIPTYLLSRKLPDRLDLQWVLPPYRGDDTNLGRRQREIMGVVALLGLWLIPTFHNITKLSPFLGALCVLALLWVVNEIYNRKLNNSDQMIRQSRPRAIQYSSLQTILYIIGIMLALGAVEETGFLKQIGAWCWTNVHNVFILGTVAGIISTVLDTFTTAMTCMTMFDIAPQGALGDATCFVQNGPYWKIIAFCTAIGGSMISVGSLSGIVLMKMEQINIRWFLHHFSFKVFIGWLCGMGFLFAEVYVFNFF
ncbi:MAG: SLC13 family permease [Prevotellaceae bacterium]|nr:SLC13 family permease [Prevotellaceae bacterium]